MPTTPSFPRRLALAVAVPTVMAIASAALLTTCPSSWAQPAPTVLAIATPR